MNAKMLYTPKMIRQVNRIAEMVWAAAFSNAAFQNHTPEDCTILADNAEAMYWQSRPGCPPIGSPENDGSIITLETMADVAIGSIS